jgi:hypothetical protein
MSDRTWEARVYRVNAWREMKGREPLTFAEPVEVPAGPRPPEWWTTENTEAWNLAQWGNADPSEAQRTWGSKIGHGERIPRASAATYTPLKPALMAKWRESDPRPSNPCYFDGTPILRYAAPAPKAKPRAKAKSKSVVGSIAPQPVADPWESVAVAVCG